MWLEGCWFYYFSIFVSSGLKWRVIYAYFISREWSKINFKKCLPPYRNPAGLITLEHRYIWRRLIVPAVRGFPTPLTLSFGLFGFILKLKLKYYNQWDNFVTLKVYKKHWEVLIYTLLSSNTYDVIFHPVFYFSILLLRQLHFSSLHFHRFVLTTSLEILPSWFQFSAQIGNLEWNASSIIYFLYYTTLQFRSYLQVSEILMKCYCLRFLHVQHLQETWRENLKLLKALRQKGKQI